MNQLLENAVVERVYANRTMKGKTYHVLRLRDGNAVFAFNPSSVDGVKEGDILSLEVRKNGDYLHLVKVLNSSNGEAKQPAQATQPVQQARSWEAERESIIRQSVAKSTAILLQNKDVSPAQFQEWFYHIHKLVKGEGNSSRSSLTQISTSAHAGDKEAMNK